MTVGDGKSQCRKMTLCCASRSGAVLASCLSALLLLPGLTAAAPGSAAGGPGNGPAAGQASSARQEACVQAAQEMEDESHPETLPEKPTPPSKAGTLELHGTFRYLYGQGRFDGRALSPRTGRQEAFREKEILPTFRTRLYLDYHLDDHWAAHTAVEDNRVLNDHELDHRAHVFRAYVTGNYPAWRYYAGRFGYKSSWGNIFDTTIDGIRIRAERKGKRAAQLVAGRIGTGQNRREGFLVSAFNIVPKKGFSLEGVYTRFRNKGNWDGKWNEQEVASLEPGYYFTPTAFLGWEHLFAKGRDRRENVGSQYGYTLNFNLGDYFYTDPGSRRIRLHYYHQPQASVIVHTMNGWPGFFDTADQRLGMKGWGLSLDYVLARGVLLTLEGYDLKSIRRSPLLGDLRQRVLGGSITFGF